ncbi:hypothetical protein OSB04_015146 [Centaurea solstitialis]|uniref:Pectate lyase n=1 Tax=Centaurea solstitialis TaxID=347529 RepID=A0AA38TBU5_9ASTR|nr:hypothetical protein OSB04_015146 [Centaurea solstitialis]
MWLLGCSFIPLYIKTSHLNLILYIYICIIFEFRRTRRILAGGCEAANQIDKCWRCKPDWAENRKALAQCVKGFAAGTTGGAAGEIYTVTDPSDDDVAKPKEGTLRWAASRTKPLWIIFDKDMVITLKNELVVASDKTIDGRGVKVEICKGSSLTLYEVKNVIVHGLNIHDTIPTPAATIATGEGPPIPRFKSDGDGIMVYGSCKIWIDHCTFAHGSDGLVDVTMGSTMVTISNCKFSNHDTVMLLGGADANTQDQNMKVTVAYNVFGPGCVQRMPRVRFGFFQIVNNCYDKWKMYAISGTMKPTILSQGNKYVAPDDPNAKQVTMRQANDPEVGVWKSTGDLFENGAAFTDSGGEPKLTPEQQGGMIAAEPAASVPALTKDAGVLTCCPGTPC